MSTKKEKFKKAMQSNHIKINQIYIFVILTEAIV